MAPVPLSDARNLLLDIRVIPTRYYSESGGQLIKIHVRRRNGDSFQRTVLRAVSILHDAEIFSAKAGGSDTLLIDPEDTALALLTLVRAGVRAKID